MQIANFIKETEEYRRMAFMKVGGELHLPPQSVEKDWWVTVVLKAIYSLDYGSEIQFKGGTSLSKCWDLISRFSEDIDLAINPELLGFGEHLSKNQVSGKLRKAGKLFILGRLSGDILQALQETGIPVDELTVDNNDNGVPTQDPTQVYISYPSVFHEDEYIAPRIVLEITGRANKAALTRREIKSLMDQKLPTGSESEDSFMVTTVEPLRTFIDKVCLLHEEFNKSHGEIRSHRMSERGIDKEVMASEELFKDIISHRFIYNRVDGVDYNTERPGTFAIIPPGENLRLWERDYRNTIEKMVYGENRPDFETIITRIRQLNEDLNRMEWKDVPIFVANK